MKPRSGIAPKLVFISLVGSLLATASAAQNSTDKQDPTAVAVLGNVRKILTPNGIDIRRSVRIGGIEQWVSVRGSDRRNPVLLYIHGGPGYVSMPMSWYSTRPWEDFFTVVQWDQRAAGKTFLLTKSNGDDLTPERMIGDTIEMADWARKTLGKQKLFVLGHSYGSFLGLMLAERHPDWCYAYIGAGQVADMPESERRGWQFAYAEAERDHNTEAIAELKAIEPYPKASGSPITDTYTERKWVTHYGGAMAFRDSNIPETDLAYLSPDYTADEIAHIWDGNQFSTPFLLPSLLSSKITPPRLEVPFLLFLGRHDKNVNADVAFEWFQHVRAPYKKVIWFENSAHLMFTEEPGTVLASLVQFVLPLAAKDLPPRQRTSSSPHVMPQSQAHSN